MPKEICGEWHIELGWEHDPCECGLEYGHPGFHECACGEEWE